VAIAADQIERGLAALLVAFIASLIGRLASRSAYQGGPAAAAPVGRRLPVTQADIAHAMRERHDFMEAELADSC
jgi:hypothetical protein